MFLCLGSEELISRKCRSSNLDDAVQGEAKALIKIAQRLSVRDTVKAQVSPSESLGSDSSIGKQLGRHPHFCPCSVYREFVNKGGCTQLNFRPKIGVF